MLDGKMIPHVSSWSGGEKSGPPSRAVTAHELGIVPFLHKMLPYLGFATCEVPVIIAILHQYDTIYLQRSTRVIYDRGVKNMTKLSWSGAWQWGASTELQLHYLASTASCNGCTLFQLCLTSSWNASTPPMGHVERTSHFPHPVSIDSGQLLILWLSNKLFRQIMFL